MRIVIRSVPPSAGDRLRVYAEYRVFSRLGSMAREITAVWVAVHRGRDGTTGCAITADLGDGGRTRVCSRQAEPSGAIDTAVDHLADVIVQRLANASP